MIRHANRGLLFLAVAAALLGGTSAPIAGNGNANPFPEVAIVDLESQKLILDQTNIRESSVKGNLLTLVVSYAGGCRDHDFTLYMSPPGFADSGDSRAILYLWHDGKSDQCGTSVGDTLVFDLLPIGELYMGLFGMTDQIALELKTGFEAPTRRIVYTPDLNFTVSSPPRP